MMISTMSPEASAKTKRNEFEELLRKYSESIFAKSRFAKNVTGQKVLSNSISSLSIHNCTRQKFLTGPATDTNNSSISISIG